MRVTIPRADLARMLTAATKVVEGRNTIPILSNVLLTVEAGKFTARATDLDAEVSASVSILDAVEGATTVPAKLLSDIAKKASGDIALELDGDILSVRSGKSRYRLETLPAGDFPDFSVGLFSAEFDIDLAALLAPVAYAMSTEEVRFYLNGAFLHVLDGKLVAVATDGHRLSRHVGPETDQEFDGVILPRKLVSMLPKGNVWVALSPSKIRITAGDTVIVSKLIDGTFPDYQRVIPTGNKNRLMIDRDAALAAIDRVSVVSTERTRAIKLDVTAERAAVSVGDKAREEVEARLDGDAMTIGFNSQYLADSLRVMPAGDVTIAMGDSGSPAVLTGQDAALTLVVMPMRV